MAKILVVDDELGIRALLSEILGDEGHAVELAENAAQARRLRELGKPDLVLLDIWMPDVDGITLLKEWSGAGLLSMPVIMMSGHGTIDTAVEATKHGASAFLEKPITLQKLLKAVDHALERPVPGRVAPLKPGLAPTAVSAALGPGAAPGAAPGASVGIAGGTAGGESAPVLGESIPSAGNVPSAAANGAAAPSGPAAQQSFDLDRPLREARDAFERSYFEFHLSQEGGSMTRVADKTGLERTHLYRKLKQLGVEVGRRRANGG